MNYIIDGHNLIAKIPGLSLGMIDDEMHLLKLLNNFGVQGRNKLEVYFDGAPSGQAGVKNFGKVRAHFVPIYRSADDAIRTRLLKMGPPAANWVVVSSDRSVQAAAREVHAKVMKAEEFAFLLQASTATETTNAKKDDRSTEQTLSKAEVDEWLAIFSKPRREK